MRDRLFWIVLMRAWAGWRRPLALVQPETVIAWHCCGGGGAQKAGAVYPETLKLH
ncbi:hypothetical protein KJ682_16040 [bacterium]|nr:hypothetical protein [bacterium]